MDTRYIQLRLVFAVFVYDNQQLASTVRPLFIGLVENRNITGYCEFVFLQILRFTLGRGICVLPAGFWITKFPPMMTLYLMKFSMTYGWIFHLMTFYITKAPLPYLQVWNKGDDWCISLFVGEFGSRRLVLRSSSRLSFWLAVYSIYQFPDSWS